MSKKANFDLSSFGGKFKAIPFINNLSVLYTLDYNTRRNDAFKKSVSCRVTDCQRQSNSTCNNPPVNGANISRAEFGGGGACHNSPPGIFFTLKPRRFCSVIKLSPNLIAVGWLNLFILYFIGNFWSWNQDGDVFFFYIF